MAAIIAQLTLANRERKKRALKHIGSAKCTYKLQPFNQHGFDPAIHNRYMMERERYRKLCQETEQDDQILQDTYKTWLVSNIRSVCHIATYLCIGIGACFRHSAACTFAFAEVRGVRTPFNMLSLSC